MNQILFTLRNLFRRSNIGTILFFALNTAVLVLVMGALGVSPYVVIPLYAASVLLALSPVGEWFLCLLNGAHRMVRKDMRDRILPAAAEVFERAKEHTPAMPDRINIRVYYDQKPNAFAIGRHTICVTEGLLQLPEDQIQGVLAHEFGHLAMQHTLVQLLIGGGNIIMFLLILLAELLRVLFVGAGSVGMGAAFFRARGFISTVITTIGAGCFFLLSGMIFVWTAFCNLLLRHSGRGNEYEADRFAYEIGFGDELCEVLDRVTLNGGEHGFLRALYDSHPMSGDRIGRLQELGARYSRY